MGHKRVSIKMHKELRGEESVHFLDLGSVIMGVHVQQNLANRIF